MSDRSHYSERPHRDRPHHSDRPYYELAEFAPKFGYKPSSAKNKIAEGTFPVKTYKLGRRIVADKAVVDAWFEMKRQEGLAALGKSTGG